LRLKKVAGLSARKFLVSESSEKNRKESLSFFSVSNFVSEFRSEVGFDLVGVRFVDEPFDRCVFHRFVLSSVSCFDIPILRVYSLVVNGYSKITLKYGKTG